MPYAIASVPDMSLEDVWASWFDGQTPNTNLTLIKSDSVEGHCYLKLLCYFPEFGRVNPIEFSKLLTKLKENLGPDPVARDALTEVCMAYFSLLKIQGGDTRGLGEIKDEDIEELVGGFTQVYDKMKDGRVRLVVVVKEDKIHIEGNPVLHCNCKTVVCQHGWSLKAVSSLAVSDKMLIGASGFDMNAFLNGGMDNDEDDFEDVYSSLTAKPADSRVDQWVEGDLTPSALNVESSSKQRVVKTTTNADYLKAQGFAPQPNHGRPTDNRKARRKIESVIAAESEPNRVIADLQSQMRELTETVARSTLSVQESLDPNDSSSVAERYTSGRRYMKHGTVIGQSPVLNYHGSAVGSTVLTVEDDMISGFVQDDVSRDREKHFVSKLKPVNGLPRPFANNRLNFLINFSTGLSRSLERYPDELLRSLYHSMSSESVVPVDNLLRQVLCITIDRHDGIVVSNPFRLPYIEIGMHVCQAAITAMIDLSMAEFRQCWFQEFKGLRIPEFWNVYQGVSQEPVQQVSRRRTETRHRDARQAPPKVSRTKTLLGF